MMAAKLSEKMARLRPGAAARPRGRAGLAAHLLILVLVPLVPVVGAGAWAVGHAVQAYRSDFEARLQDSARALALAVESEIDTHVAAATALAGSPLAARADPAEFRDWAAEVGRSLGTWVVLSSLEPGLPQLVNTLLPPDVTPPRGGPVEAIERMTRLGQPVVADLFGGHASRRPIASVVAPVTKSGRDGVPPRAVGIILDPARFAQMLQAEGVEGGIAAIADGNGRVVARSRDHEQHVGSPAPSWYAMAQTAQQGVFRGETLDGAPALFGFRRLGGDSRWAVVVSAPLDAYNRSWQRPLIGLASGVAVALALGLLAARWLAARLLAPVSDLVQHARAVAASGGDVDVSARVAPASIAEFEELRTAIETSDGALRRRAEAERRAAIAAAESEARQAALMREVDHRAKNALAVVQAVIRLAPPDEPKRFAAAMETRVMALSRAHVLLAAKNWDGAGLREVAEAGLSAVPAAGDAVELDGPDLTIDPQAVQAVALVLHELAKIAIPAGAPPRDGKAWARLSWEVDREAAALDLEWRDSLHADQDSDGEAQGFGGRIVNALVKAQLGGIVSARPDQDGRVVSIRLPARRVMARQRNAVAGEAA